MKWRTLLSFKENPKSSINQSALQTIVDFEYRREKEYPFFQALKNKIKQKTTLTKEEEFKAKRTNEILNFFTIPDEFKHLSDMINILFQSRKFDSFGMCHKIDFSEINSLCQILDYKLSVEELSAIIEIDNFFISKFLEQQSQK